MTFAELQGLVSSLGGGLLLFITLYGVLSVSNLSRFAAQAARLLRHDEVDQPNVVAPRT
jgi:hypothetical protein